MLTGGLYSSLQKALLEARGAPRAAEAAMWHAWLDGAQRRGEFRGTERQWLGLDAWLDRQEGKIPREALQEFARSHRLQFEVVVKGAIYPSDVTLPAGWSVQEDPDQLWRVRDDHRAIAGIGVTLADALRTVPGSTQDVFGGDPLYSDYVLPGGEAYREVLIRLRRPTSVAEIDISALLKGEHKSTWEAMQRLRQRSFGTPGYAAVLEEEAHLYARLRDQSAIDAGGIHPPFARSHFSETNVLAHLRLTQRHSVDGKKVLFIEELQSDWHQAGRSFGYRPAEIFRVLSGVDGRRLAGPFADQQLAEEVAASHRRGGEPARVEPEKEHTHVADMRVPDAPFRPTAEWAVLAFKQALRTAVQTGADAIAWTTGDMQTARYDLTGRLSSLTWAQRSDGLFDLVGTRAVSGVEVSRPGLSPAEMSAMVGKEVTGRIVQAAAACKDPRDRQGVLDHEGLRLVGDGMRAFYDNILPHAIGRYVKPMGGATTSVVLPLPGGKVTQVPGVLMTSAMRECVREGQPLFRRARTGTFDSGMDVHAVADIVRDYLGKYRHGTHTVAVRIGETLEDLYGPGASDIMGSSVAGAYHPSLGLLSIVADRMRDRECVEATIRHELFGHFGLNTFLPKDKRAILDAVIASRDAPGMSAIWDAIDRRYVDRDLDTRAEEVFAWIAEQPRGLAAQLWDQLLALVNRGLRAVGLTEGRTSKAELHVLAQSIAKGIREGHRRQQTFPATDDAQFRRMEAPPIGFLLARNQSERLHRMAPDHAPHEPVATDAAPSP